MTTGMEINHIRPLRPSDIDAALAIIKQNYLGEGYEISAQSELEAMFRNAPLRPYYLVYEDSAGRVLGFGGQIQSWMDYHIYELFWINVAPDAQRRGIGSKLVSALFDVIQREDPHTKAVIGSALHAEFYKKLGCIEQVKLHDGSTLLVKHIS